MPKRKRGRPPAPQEGTREEHLAHAIDQAVRQPDDETQMLATIASLERAQDLDLRTLALEIRQVLDDLPPDSPERVAILAKLEFDSHRWATPHGPPDYSRIEDVLAQIDEIARMREQTPRGRGAQVVGETWQERERQLLTAKLDLPGSQATLERARRRARSSR